LRAGAATDGLPVWSPNGRFLSWSQQEASGTTIEVADTRTGKVRSISIEASPASQAVTDTGAVNAVEFGSNALFIEPGKAPRTYGPPYVNAGAAYTSGLYDVAMQGQHDNVPVVEHYSLSGRRRQVVTLPRLAQGASPYEQGWASSDGRMLVVEHGDHTDVCGVGPTSTLTTITAAGRTHLLRLPPLRGEVQRVAGLSFGPAGSFEATLIECPSNAGDPGWPTRVVEYRRGHWRVVGDRLLAGSVSPGGVQAVAEGQLLNQGPDGPDPVPRGGPVLISGHAVRGLPGRATDVAWSPR
jgi:hypothetical protein